MIAGLDLPPNIKTMKTLHKLANELHAGLILVLAALFSLEFHAGHYLLLLSGRDLADLQNYPLYPFQIGFGFSAAALAALAFCIRKKQIPVSKKAKNAIYLLAIALILGNEGESLYYRDYAHCAREKSDDQLHLCGSAPMDTIHFRLFDATFRIRFFIDSEHDWSPRVLNSDHFEFY